MNPIRKSRLLDGTTDKHLRELTLAAMSCHRREQKIEQIQRIEPNVRDEWWTFAVANRVEPIVAHALFDAFGDSFQAPKDGMQRMIVTNDMSILLSEFDRIAAAMHEQGIRMLALKNAGDRTWPPHLRRMLPDGRSRCGSQKAAVSCCTRGNAIARISPRDTNIHTTHHSRQASRMVEQNIVQSSTMRKFGLSCSGSRWRGAGFDQSKSPVRAILSTDRFPSKEPRSDYFHRSTIWCKSLYTRRSIRTYAPRTQATYRR